MSFYDMMTFKYKGLEFSGPLFFLTAYQSGSCDKKYLPLVVSSSPQKNSGKTAFSL
jgi:hypothetical protein